MDGERKDNAAASTAQQADLASWAASNSPIDAEDDSMQDAPDTAASSSSSAAAAAAAPAKSSKSDVFVSFPAWPVVPLAPPAAGSTQTKLNFAGQAQTFQPFALPTGFTEKTATSRKKKDKAEGSSKGDTEKKEKGGKDGASKSEKGKEKAATKDKKDDSSPKKKKTERVEDPLDRISADKNASSPLESFQNLLSSVRGIPLADLQKAGRDADTSAYLSSLAPALQVTHLHEIPYISHFTWLFAKVLYIRAVEPSRLEAMLLHPDDVLNESLCSELLSKLLYATRVSFPVKDSSFRKKLEMMQQNQPVFHANLLGEWMFWLMELWIAIWKKKCEREALQSSKMNQDAEEGEGDEGEAGAAAAAGASADGDAPRKKRKYTKRADKPEESESSEDEADGAEDEEEQGAYNLHLLPERKFIVNTEELCGNINPFAPPARDAATAAPATDAMEDEKDNAAASSSSSAAAASSAAASSSSAAAAASATAAAPAPISSEGHKLFHETPLLFRAAFLKILCDYQLAVNPAVINRLRKDLETKDLRTAPLGRDMHGKHYYFFGFADYRIYVQGTTEHVKLPKDAIELEEERVARERKAAETAMLDALRLEVESKVAAEAKNKAAKAKAKKAMKEIDDDAPLAIVAQQQKQAEAAIVPISSLSSLAAPQADAAAASSSPSPAAAAASSPSSSGPFPHGLPFPLKVHDAASEPERRVFWTPPPPPPFALLTSSPAEIRTLLQRFKSMGDERNDKLYIEVKSVLEELEAGRGRKEEALEEKKSKKDPAAPKRVSDRLVTQELLREEAERIKAIKQLEDARHRNTRRNRWLDDVSQRTVAKLKRAVEKFLGIEREKKKKEDDEEGDNESKASVTDDEAPERGRTTRGGGSAKGVKKQRGGRVTRTRGRAANGSMAESETESEDEHDSDDEGCYVCATVDAPEDGSNPILFCDKCDKQICLGCVPLERVPTGKFFCPLCVAANPKIR